MAETTLDGPAPELDQGLDINPLENTAAVPEHDLRANETRRLRDDVEPSFGSELPPLEAEQEDPITWDSRIDPQLAPTDSPNLDLEPTLNYEPRDFINIDWFRNRSIDAPTPEPGIILEDDLYDPDCEIMLTPAIDPDALRKIGELLETPSPNSQNGGPLTELPKELQDILEPDRRGIEPNEPDLGIVPEVQEFKDLVRIAQGLGITPPPGLDPNVLINLDGVNPKSLGVTGSLAREIANNIDGIAPDLEATTAAEQQDLLNRLDHLLNAEDLSAADRKTLERLVERFGQLKPEPIPGTMVQQVEPTTEELQGKAREIINTLTEALEAEGVSQDDQTRLKLAIIAIADYEATNGVVGPEQPAPDPGCFPGYGPSFDDIQLLKK